MMANTHVAFGTTLLTATVATGVVLESKFDLPSAVDQMLTPEAAIFLLPIAAFFMLAPDADAPRSRISQAHPWLGKAFRTVFTQHRGASHYLITALAFGVGFTALMLIPGSFTLPASWPFAAELGEIPFARLIFALIYASAVSLAVGMMWFKRSRSMFVITIAAFFIALTSSTVMDVPFWGLGIAVATGMMLHSIGDMTTPSGVAWLYPIIKREIHLPQMNGSTGKERETKLIMPIFWMTATACVFLLVALYTGMVTL